MCPAYHQACLSTCILHFSNLSDDQLRRTKKELSFLLAILPDNGLLRLRGVKIAIQNPLKRALMHDQCMGELNCELNCCHKVRSIGDWNSTLFNGGRAPFSSHNRADAIYWRHLIALCVLWPVTNLSSPPTQRALWSPATLPLLSVAALPGALAYHTPHFGAWRGAPAVCADHRRRNRGGPGPPDFFVWGGPVLSCPPTFEAHRNG